MKRFLALLLLPLLLTACSDYSSERKEVADLMDRVDQADASFQELMLQGLPMTEADIMDRLEMISDEYTAREEVFDKDLGILLADFKAYRKIFKKLGEKQAKIKEDLELSKKQLLDLDNDLKNRSVDAQMVEKYLDDERLACETVEQNVLAMKNLYLQGGKGYGRKVIAIDSVISSLGLQYPQ